jgi:hypothetical protein
MMLNFRSSDTRSSFTEKGKSFSHTNKYKLKSCIISIQFDVFRLQRLFRLKHGISSLLETTGIVDSNATGYRRVGSGLDMD